AHGALGAALGTPRQRHARRGRSQTEAHLGDAGPSLHRPRCCEERRRPRCPRACFRRRSRDEGGLRTRTQDWAAAMSALGADEGGLMAEEASAPHTASAGVAAISEFAALWMMILTLAWVQFPFGSNRPWAWSLLSLLVATTWLVWLPVGLLKS